MASGYPSRGFQRGIWAGERAAKQDCLACGCFRDRRQPKQLCLGVGLPLPNVSVCYIFPNRSSSKARPNRIVWPADVSGIVDSPNNCVWASGYPEVQFQRRIWRPITPTYSIKTKNINTSLEPYYPFTLYKQIVLDQSSKGNTKGLRPKAIKLNRRNFYGRGSKFD